MSNPRKPQQENENVDLRFENLRLVLKHYDLMKELYTEQKNDLEIALKEIARLKQQLQQQPQFQFNVN